MEKKICIITPSHWSYRMGGLEYQVKLLVDHLSEVENVKIVYLAKKLDKNFKSAEYNLVKISNNKFFQKYGFFTDAPHLLVLLKNIRPDIIYQRGGSAFTGVASYYAKMNNCEMVWHISSDNDLSHGIKWFGYLPQKIIEKTMLYWGIKNAGVIISQTEYQKNLVCKINPYAKVHIVRNFHPVPDRKKNYKKKNNIIWVGNIKKVKQPEIFIKLARELRNRNLLVNCLMVGAPSFRGDGYQQMIETCISESNNLKYLGELKIDKVNELLGKSLLLINTSKWEGFPNTFIQAWMRKTAVVSLNCDPDDIIKKFYCGSVSGNFSQLVDDVVGLVKNKNKRNQMGENAYNFAIENHSLKNLFQMEKIIVG